MKSKLPKTVSFTKQLASYLTLTVGVGAAATAWNANAAINSK